MNNGALLYSNKEIKRMARAALAKKGALLKLIFAIFLCAVIRFGTELAAASVYSAAVLVLPDSGGFLDFFITLAIRVLSVFFMAPAVLGTFRLASMLSSGEDAPLTEMFLYFSPRKYFRALGAYLIAALPIEIYLFIAELTLSLVAYVAELLALDAVWSDGVSSFIAASFAVAAVALFLPYCRLFSVLAATVNGEGQRLSSCVRAATRATRGNVFRIFGLAFSFVPLILLSLLTVGILLFAFTLPYMLLSYFYFNDVLFGKDPKPQITEEVTFDER